MNVSEYFDTFFLVNIQSAALSAGAQHAMSEIWRETDRNVPMTPKKPWSKSINTYEIEFVITLLGSTARSVGSNCQSSADNVEWWNLTLCFVLYNRNSMSVNLLIIYCFLWALKNYYFLWIRPTKAFNNNTHVLIIK